MAIIPAMLILPFYILPMNLGRPIITYDGRRLMEILWAGVLVLFLLLPAQRTAASRLWSTLPFSARAAAGALVLGALLSALISSLPPYAVRGWSLLTLLLVTMLPLGALLAPVRWKVLEVLGLTVVLYGILVFGDPLGHGFDNPRFQGQVLAVAAPALLFSGNYTLALMAAPAVAVGAANGSRALWLTLAVVTLVTPFLWDDRRRRMAAGLVGLGVAGGLLGVLIWMGEGAAVESAVRKGASSSARLALWRDTFERFLQDPLLGAGPGLMAREPGVGGRFGHPHNSVLLVAAELGLVGLVSAAVLTYHAVRRVWALPFDRRPWALALMGGGFHSLLSGTTVMPASQAFLVLSAALVLPAAGELPPPGQPDSPQRLRPRAGWVFAVAGAAALIILLVTLFMPPADIFANMAPRLFKQGLIP